MALCEHLRIVYEREEDELQRWLAMVGKKRARFPKMMMMQR